jgi:hypothetical protein
VEMLFGGVILYYYMALKRNKLQAKNPEVA